jgi:hypothetical protein
MIYSPARQELGPPSIVPPGKQPGHRFNGFVGKPNVEHGG